MGTDQDAFALQGRDHDSTGGNQTRGDAAAEVPAAAVILKAAVFDAGGIIRMAWPESTAAVVTAAGVRVGDQDRDGCSGGPSFKNAADDPERIGFLPGCGDPARRTPKSQLTGDKSLIHRNSGRQPIDHRSDLRSVTLTEEGDGNAAAKGVLHKSETPHKGLVGWSIHPGPDDVNDSPGFQRFSLCFS